MKRILLFALLALLESAHLNAQTQTVGLFTNNYEKGNEGYVLFPPYSNSNTTYLVNMCGKLVHTWPSDYTPGADAYLLPDGTLLRSGHLPNPVFDVCGCGTGGFIERRDWVGNLIWHYTISDSLETQSHDVHYMPNGNILAVVWENIPAGEVAANGRKSSILGPSLYSPKIVEIQPLGADSGIVVWEWRLWNHLIQDYDVRKLNYGVVSDHPELMDLNYINLLAEPHMSPDWIHMNSVDYNPDLDQVLLSAHNNSEIWVIDHSTTIKEAASHSGGRLGKGGDFLYRWGNPLVYKMGTAADQKLFEQHNPTWITNGKYKGQILVFNNGLGKTVNFSTVDILQPPVDSTGNYALSPGFAYEPGGFTWSYSAAKPTDFFSAYMGGAQMMPDGNIMVTDAGSGEFFVVDTTASTILWDYVNPINNGTAIKQGNKPSFNAVYKCQYYPANYVGFSGLSLTATLPIEIDPLPYTCDEDSTAGTPIVNSIQRKITIVPNPVVSACFIQNAEGCTYTITDITGRQLKYGIIYSGNQATDMSSFSAGLYMLTLKHTRGQVENIKLVKQ